MSQFLSLRIARTTISHKKITSADLQDVHSGLVHEWGNLWNRDAAGDTSQNWPEAAEFVTALQDCPLVPLSKAG